MKALDGVKILDLSTGAAGFAGTLLASLGADVLKVESPEGDIARRAVPTSGGDSLFHWHYNLGKRQISLAPDDPELRRYLLGADAVITGGHDLPFGRIPELAEHPGLIRAEISGFGRGSRETWKATDLIAQAAGGMMYVNGNAGEAPLRAYGEQAHHLAGHYLMDGIILALGERRRTGRGSLVEVSLQEAVASAIEHVGVFANYEGHFPVRQGDLHWVNAYAIFECSDGWVTTCWNRNWDDVVTILSLDGSEADLADEQYRGLNYYDYDNVQVSIQHIRDVFSDWAKKHTVQEVFELGQSFRQPWAPVNPPEIAMKDPHLAARNFFVELPGPDGRLLPASSGPATMSATPWKPAIAGDASKPDWPAHAPSPERVVAPGRRAGAPLAGIRVLDFTWVLAGPFSTRILADYGAEVIKVQTDRRMVGYVGAGYFSSWNRGKLGITLDMDHAEARAIAAKLASTADIVVDNFSARVMRNWGLDEESLRRGRPDTIVAHLSGMGHSGPYANYVSYGPTAQALTGLTYLTSYKEGPPIGFGFSYSDHVAGLSLAGAVIAALEFRDRTGIGQTIDVSQFESSAALMGTAYLEAATDQPPRPAGNAGSPFSVGPAGVFRCQGDDRWIAVEAVTISDREALFKVIDITDVGFAEEALTRWAGERTAEDAARELQEQGIAASIVANGFDLTRYDENLRERNFWTQAEHPEFGTTRFDGPPILLDGVRGVEARPSPTIGQHNGYVYGEILGLGLEELADLERRGILK